MSQTQPVASLILSPRWYLVRSTNHEVPHYVVFYSPILLHPSWARTFPSVPCSRTDAAYIGPLLCETAFHVHRQQKKNFYHVLLYILFFIAVNSNREDKRL